MPSHLLTPVTRPRVWPPLPGAANRLRHGLRAGIVALALCAAIATPALADQLAAPLAAPAPAASAPSFAHCPAFTIDTNGNVVRTLAPCPSTPPPPVVLHAPYVSQFDGSAYAETNCGPTALSMALGALKVKADQTTLRQLADVQMGTSNPNSGTTWESLAYAAQAKGATVSGLEQGTGYRQWTIADLQGELAQGHPVILLVRYRDLPGNGQSPFGSDHYILALSFDKSGNLVYNDPAYYGTAGAGLTMTPRQLNLAWSNTSVGLVDTAMALSA